MLTLQQICSNDSFSWGAVGAVPPRTTGLTERVARNWRRHRSRDSAGLAWGHNYYHSSSSDSFVDSKYRLIKVGSEASAVRHLGGRHGCLLAWGTIPIDFYLDNYRCNCFTNIQTDNILRPVSDPDPIKFYISIFFLASPPLNINYTPSCFAGRVRDPGIGVPLQPIVIIHLIVSNFAFN